MLRTAPCCMPASRHAEIDAVLLIALTVQSDTGMPSIAAPAIQPRSRAQPETGVDFDYLLGQAQARERAARRCARRHLQRVRPLSVHRTELARAWSRSMAPSTAWAGRRTRSGRPRRPLCRRAIPRTRQAILALRNDPARRVADGGRACLATTRTRSRGRSAATRPAPTSTWRTSWGWAARKTFLTRDGRPIPTASGAALFPAAARANRNIFYASNGQPRSLQRDLRALRRQARQGAAAAGATGRADRRASRRAARSDRSADATVITGNGESAAATRRRWASTTLGQLQAQPASDRRCDACCARRPTPRGSPIMMLASLGANR